MPIFNGTSGVDNITGSASDDTINGLDGNDSLYGGKGNDLFNGGLGDDLINGQDGIWDLALYTDATGAVTVNLALGTATGAAGNDTLLGIERVVGSAYGDTLTGNSGDNTFEGIAGNDTIDGGPGSDWAEYFNASAGVTVNLDAGTATGGAGTDVLSNIENIVGSQHGDVLTGDVNGNSLTGFSGNDSLYGGKGNDNLTGGLGDDSLDGGDGSDSAAYYDATSGVTVNLATGTATGGGGTDVLVSIESANGSNFNDLLTGNSLSNYLGGGAGNDTMDGAAGNDNLAGGQGDDSLNGGADYDNIDYSSSATAAVIVNLATGTASGGDGNDVLLNIEGASGSAFNDHITGNSGGNNLSGRDGNDTLLGGDGNDNLTGGAGDDSLDGGVGTDAANYNEATAGVTINLAAGTVTGGSGTDSLTSIENGSGSQFNDSLTGDDNANRLDAQLGNDTLLGAGGNDNLIGGLGDDSLDGGAGFDYAQYNDATAGVIVNLSAGTASGGAGNDVLAAIEYVYGSSYGDTLTGDANANVLDGQAGHDLISGGGGQDTLIGGDGNDTLYGGTEADTLIGGAGNDTMDGGAIVDRVNLIDLNFAHYLSATSGVNINLATGSVQDGQGGTDTLVNINFVLASNFDDTVTGSTVSDLFEQFEGGAGNDIIDGGAIDPVLQLNANRATYHSATAAVSVNLAAGTATGGAGNDTLININHVRGTSYADTLIGSNTSLTEQFEGRAGSDTIDGAGGIDMVRYDSATVAVNVNLVTNLASDGLGGTDTLSNIEGIRGSTYGDTLTGGNTANGSGAIDGFEFFMGQGGNDTIDGGAGYDRADYTNSTTGVNVTLGGTSNGTASDGWGGTDTLINIEGIRASENNDTLTGSDTGAYESFEGRGGSDTIDGKGGTDRIDYQSATAGVSVNIATGTASDGYGGTDSFTNIEAARGSAFNDTLVGDTNANHLTGGAGNDTLTGGASSDTFVFTTGSQDLVTDFVAGAGGDVIDIQACVASLTNFGGGDPFASGHVRLVQAGADTQLQVDGDGSGAGVFQTIAVLTNVTASNLTTANFAGGYDPVAVASGVNLTGTPGVDTLTGGANNDTVSGLEGNDSLSGASGNDVIMGGDGADSMAGGDGNDTLIGGAGSDTLIGGAGNDSVDGGAILDLINLTDLNFTTYSGSTSAVNINLATGFVQDGLGGTDTLVNVNVIAASSFDDTVTGSSSSGVFEQFEGGAGNDTIDGGVIDPVLQRNSNRVTYQSATSAVSVNLASGTATGGAGSDTLININYVRGSGHNDTLTGSNSNLTEQFEGRAGNDTIDGAGGTDMVRYDSATEAVNVSLATNTANDGLGGTDVLSNIEGIRGSSFNDTLTGGNTANGAGATDGFEFFLGGAGNDTINGGAGYDRVDFTSSTEGVSVTLGGTGNGTASDGLGGTDTLISMEGVRGSALNDTLTGSDTGTFETFEGREGNDVIDGKGGTDRVDYSIATSGAVVNLSTGTAADGYGTTDTLSNIENIRGSAFNDSLTGNTGNNDINGQAGNDTLVGGDGNDSLDGGAGADSLSGGNGNDYMRGADGANDILDGGADYDTANYSFGGTAPVTFTATGASGTQADGLGGVDTLVSIEELHIFGGSGGDTLTGDFLRQYIQGNGGNDTLTGGAGNDTFAYDFGQANGTDRITDLQLGDNFSFNHFGGALVVLDSTIQTGDNPAALTRGQIMVGVPSGGVTKVYVGTDNNLGGDLTIELQGDYLASDFSVFNSGFGGSLNYNPSQNLTGTSGNDTINGAGSADMISGLAGNDNLNGQGGNDSVLGGDGDDYITAGGSGDGGSDTIDGGAGFDIVSYNFGGATAGVTFTASNTGTQVDPLGGTDTLISIEEMHIFGGSGADTLTGNGVRNYIRGNGGNDTLTGGAGNDTFSYDFGQASGTDRITDLQSGDNFNFDDIGPDLDLLDSTIQTGDNPASLTRGQIMVGAPADGITKIYVGTDGTPGGDLTIELQGNYAAANFSVFNYAFGGSNLNYSPGQNLTGTAGNDTLTGGTGNDTLSGLEGNDSLTGDLGHDSLSGGGGDDFFREGPGANGGGNDTLDGGAGIDFVGYHFNNQTSSVNFTASSGSTQVDPLGGTDTLISIEEIHAYGGSAGDTLTGNSGRNYLEGNGGNDTLLGLGGQDNLAGGAGNDSLDGGTITDRSNYTDLNTVIYSSATSGVNVNLQTGTASDGLGGTDTLTNLNFVLGSSHNDTLTGSNTANMFEQFEGGLGDDTIDGGLVDPVNQQNSNRANYSNSSAAVTVNLAAGTAAGGSGNDTLININHVRGSFHSDTLIGSNSSLTEQFEGRGGSDTIDGAGGHDMVRYDSASVGVNVNLVTNTASDGLGGTDTLSNIEGIRGSGFNDTLTGGNTANGTGATDGFEFFLGQGGNDIIDGGGGYDRADYYTATTGASVTLGGTSNGTASDGQGGTDTLINIEAVRGSDFNDTLTGSDTGTFESFEGRAGNDTIDGKGGTDRIDYQSATAGVVVSLSGGTASDGYGGTDTFSNIENVRGSAFNDHLKGDANVNWLEGGAGNDTLYGFTGNDVFVFAPSGVGVDTILDFEAGDIVGIGATLTAGTATAGDGSAVTGKNVQVSSSGGVTTLWIDTNNVAGAELQINLTGTFAASSFTVTDNLDGRSSITRTSALTVTGTAGNDTLTGGSDNDTLDGLAGHDTLDGGAGNDSLIGGSGDDWFVAGAGADTLDGGSGYDRANYVGATAGIVVNLATGTASSDGSGSADTLVGIERVMGSNFADSITGSGADDDFSGNLGNDTLDGGAGFDFVWYGGATAAVQIDLQAGTATGGEDNDQLVSIEGIAGSRYADNLQGSAVDNYFRGDGGLTDLVGGNDTINGQGGFDVVDYRDDPAAVTVNLQTKIAQDGRGGQDSITSIEEVRGSNFNDSITGSTELWFERFEGRDGNDTIDGGAITDTVNQTNGNQVSYRYAGAAVTVDLLAGSATGGAGTDVLSNINEARGSAFNDTLAGSNRTDVTELFEGREGDDLIDGRGGFDIVRFDNATDGVTASLWSGTATGGGIGNDTFTNVEGLWGSIHGDVLTGGNAANGTVATDPALSEFFVGGAGNDTIDGGQGYDMVSYQNSAAAVVITLNDALDGVGVDGFGGFDVLRNIEGVRGSAHNDALTGSNTAAFESFEGREGNDTIDGNGGTDRADYARSKAGVVVNLATGTASDGYGGTDTLSGIENVRGSTFNDTISGDANVNRLEGGLGNDTLTGGAGNDLFAFASSGMGVDTITDFEAGDIVGIGATLTAGTATAGDGSTVTGKNVQVSSSGGVTTLWIDTNNAAGAELQINLTGTFAASSFTVTDNLDGRSSITRTSALTVTGTAGNDTLTGGSDNDTLDGLAGNDTLSGGAGSDSLIGNSGDDWLTGGAGVDTLDGGAGYDTANYETAGAGIVVTQASGTVPNDGNGSSDVLVGIERIIGSNFADSITGSSGNNDFSGYLGNDTIDGGAGFDFVWYGVATAAVQVDLQAGTATGGEGNDQLISIEGVAGSRFADNLKGSTGDDYFRGDGSLTDLVGGNDTIDGRGGFDTVDYRDDPGAVTVNLQTQTAQDGRGAQDTLISIEEVLGSSGNDSITGSTSLWFERFEGRGGNDTIDGGAITDTLNQTNGNQVSYRNATGAVSVDLLAGSATGAAGTDVLSNINEARGSAFNDTLAGSNRTDVTELFEGREGDDVIDGRGGFDIVRFDNATGGVTASLVSGTATGGGIGSDTFTNVEGLWGSGHADVLTGGNAANGTAAATDPAMNPGLLEFFVGGGGNDTIDGGQGFDLVSYQTSTVGVSVTLNDTLDGVGTDGFGGTDVLRNIEGVRGSAHNDVLTGSNTAAYESFEGREGNDTIDGLGGTDRADYVRSTAGVVVNLATGTASDGYGGTDTLTRIENMRGSTFNDTLTGDANANWLEGQTGNDTMTGGAGNDVFAYGAGGAGIDTITDFAVGDVVGIGAALTTATATAGDGSAVTGKNVQVSSSGGVTTLWIDTNNVAGAELQINLTGTFTASQFSVKDVGNGTSSITLASGQALTGTSGNDTLSGTGGNDTLAGLAGNDVLNGGAGNDNLDGGADSDTASFAGATGAVTAYLWSGQATGADGTDTLTNIENLTGSGFDDRLDGGNTANSIAGGAGADTVNGFAGNDTLTGGAGNDALDGGADIDTASYAGATGGVTALLWNGQSTGEGTDTLASIENLTGSGFNDRLDGENTANNLSGGAGADSLYGYGGNDTLVGGAGNDVLDGSADIDTASFAGATGAVTVLLWNGQASGADGTDSLVSIENLTGSGFNDRLDGDNSVNVLDGGAGADTLLGYDGNDTLIGGAGNDSLTGGNGNDTFRFAASANGIDTIADLTLDDTILVEAALGAVSAGDGSAVTGKNVQVSSSAGVTTLWIDTNSAAGAEVQINIAGTYAASNLKLVDNGNGTSSITRAAALNLSGTAGNDTLTGAGTNDTLSGLAGNDVLIGGAGNDNLDGGADSDTASYAGATGAVTALLWNGQATGADGTDILTGIENLTGSGFNDRLDGENTANNLSGGAGADSLYGYGGNDTLNGGAGNDVMDGGADFDTASFAGATGAVTAFLWSGQATGDGSDTMSSIENLTGSGFNDRLDGDNSVNVLDGGAGADTLLGYDGNDTLIGGAGNDSLTGGNGNDTFRFAASANGNDTIADLTLDDTILVEAALGAISAGDGSAVTGKNVQVSSSAGVTTLWIDTNSAAGAEVQINIAGTYTASNLSLVNNGNGTSSITRAAALNLSGTAGNDTLTGAGTNDTLSGLAGNDVLIGGAGNDNLDGGADSDTASFAGATGAVTAYLWGSQATGADGTDALISIENLVGSGFNDRLDGDNSANSLSGGAGADSLYGYGGNDTLSGGAGNDVLDGSTDIDTATYATATGAVVAYLWSSQVTGDGTDTLTSIENLIGSGFNDRLDGTNDANSLDGGAGADSLLGYGGNDTLTGGAGNDLLDGGADVDTVNYSGATGAITAFLWNSQATGDGTDTLYGIETLIGSGFNDRLDGDNSANTLNGGVGADTLYAYAGNDTVIGSAGNDVMDGGADTDTASYAGATGAVTVYLWSGQATGADGSDTLGNFENLIGSGFNDRLDGTNSANILEGGAGADTVFGYAGSDTLNGGAGNDVLDGGADADAFVFDAGSGADLIYSFATAQSDKIHLKSGLNGSGIASAAQALAATTDVGGYATVNLGSGHTITLVGVTTASLSAADFVIF